QGSAGTLGCSEYIREIFPRVKVAAAEALQCPTLLFNGYGAHRIEGIGDKHIPWIHNIKNMDIIVDIDDEATISLMRLFNEPEGKTFLAQTGIVKDFIDKLDLLGISSIANILTAIKTARYYEMNENDILFTLATDSMEMYQSRINEYSETRGDYTYQQAAIDHAKYLENIGIDHMLELGHYDKRRLHNLKYFTWVEQQGKDVEELDAQWYDENYWKDKFGSFKELDKKIKEFNEKTGLLKKYL
ncbi:pyridoxal-5-phosphate-dependent protein subunit beta, partial [Elusimicrobiota bacterium]